jgi:hypothetical protein
MEAARFKVGLFRCVAQQGDFGGKAEVTVNVFFDSSALAKRYGRERKRSGSSHPLFSISVGRLGALHSGNRLGPVPPSARTQGFNSRVPKCQDDATVIGITEQVVAQAVALLEQFPLRSADALNVACASKWSTDFVSADDRQCGAARADGLRVEAIRV